MSEIEILKSEIRAFADARAWEIFHTPKNLAMAIAGESGELVAEFQWLTPQESVKETLGSVKLDSIRMEIADVAIYLLRLTDVLDIDLAQAIRDKMAVNESRFQINS